MKIVIKVVITFLFLVIPISPVVAVTQGTDEVTLNKPAEGSIIQDKYTLEWKITDSEIDDPAYFVDVFNLSCNESGGNLGRVTSSGAQKNGGNYTYQWDTAQTTFASILRDDGNYCLRVCGILANGGSVYSLCDKKSFVFSSQQSGSNKPPSIVKSTEPLEISLNQIFSFKVDASDPDGDPITYSLVTSPDFMSIDSSTGLVTGKPNEVGNLRFIVNADDKKGGIDTEEFILNVLSGEVSNEVKFIFPVSGSVLTSDNNILEWDLQSGIQVKSIVISYSQDKKDWKDLTRLDRNIEKYTWNIASVEKGEYYLRIQLTDKDNKLFEVISSKFNIGEANATGGTKISSLEPKEGSVIETIKPTISAKFEVPEGVSVLVDQIKFFLDDREDLTVCDKTATEIKCTPVGELTNGKHVAYIEIKDSNGVTVANEWSFTISEDGEGGADDSPTITANTVQIIIIIFAVGFVLIALPWSVYLFIKRKRAAGSGSTNATSTTPLPMSPTEQTIALPGAVPVQSIESGTLQTQPMQTQQVQTEPQSVLAPEMPANPNLNPYGYDVVPNTTLPSLTNEDTSVSIGQNTQSLTDEAMPISNTEPIGDISTFEINTPEMSVPSVTQDITTTPTVDTAKDNSINSFNNTVTEGPSMYSQDEIPQWLQSSTANVPNSSENMKTDMEEKTNAMEDAKVYDPYGLALNPDEVQNHN